MDKLESILARARDFEARLPDFTEIASRLPDFAEMLTRQPDFTRVLSRFSRDMEALERSISRARRRRKKFEDTIARDNHCKRKGCKGALEIKDRTHRDIVIGSSLVCNKCNYKRLESPEYARCYHADAFLEAAEKLKGKPPLPASYNAYQACELYLRELGGSYYYRTDDDDLDGEPDFVSPSSKHSLVTLRRTIEESRRDRLDAKQVDGESFKEVLFRLPEGLWPLLRYGEADSLRFSGNKQPAKPSIGKDGRLFINEVDVYEVLVLLAWVMNRFVGEEFRRNLE